MGIFLLDNPPHTVTYKTAIDRVRAFGKLEKLDGNLQKKLHDFDNHRNKLEHYNTYADQEDLIQLFGAILDPTLDIFKEKFSEIKELLHKDSNSNVLKKIQGLAQKYNEREAEVIALVNQLRGTEIQGNLLNWDTSFTLPRGKSTRQNFCLSGTGIEVDFLIEGPGKGKANKVAIEVKPDMHMMSNQALDMLAVFHTENIQPWLIISDRVPGNEPVRNEAKKKEILLTGIDEWRNLEKQVRK